MNEPRAFCGACTVGDQYVYVFGGFRDYDVLNSIEKYDCVVDSWQLLNYKMPSALAKLGVCVTDSQRQIAIVGGMNATFHRQKTLTMFDLKTMKFSNQSDMKSAKTFNGIVHFHEGFIYAFGGNEKDLCERFDTYSNKWEPL
jgi:hypothetical protein